VITRTCAVCYSSQPLSALGAWGTALACLDIRACDERAAASGMYPVIETDEALAVHEAASGAVRRRPDPHEDLLDQLRRDRQADRLAGATEVAS